MDGVCQRLCGPVYDACYTGAPVQHCVPAALGRARTSELERLHGHGTPGRSLTRNRLLRVVRTEHDDGTHAATGRKSRDMTDNLLALISRGHEAWNTWRMSNPGLNIDLQGANLAQHDISHMNLSEANLSGITVTKKTGPTDYFNKGVIVRNVDLRRSNMESSNFRSATLHESKLANTKGAAACFSGAQFHQCDLSEADLTDSQLDHATFHGGSLRNAKLSNANLHFARFIRVDLRGVCLDNVKVDRYTEFQDCVTDARIVGIDNIERPARLAEDAEKRAFRETAALWCAALVTLSVVVPISWFVFTADRRQQDRILESANVVITIDQQITNATHFMVFDYEPPVRALVSDVIIDLALSDLEVTVSAIGRGIDAVYRGGFSGGVYTTGAEFRGTITFATTDGARRAFLDFSGREEPLRSVRGGYNYPAEAFAKILERDIRPALTAFAMEW